MPPIEEEEAPLLSGAGTKEPGVPTAAQPGVQQQQLAPGQQGQTGGAGPTPMEEAGVRRSSRSTAGKPPDRYSPGQPTAVVTAANGVAAAGVSTTASAASGAGIKEPASYGEAITSPQGPFWRDAMDEEMAAHASHETWRLEKPPPGAKVIGGKWVYAIKYGSSGELERFKARYVAKGCSQTKGVDFNEVFAPTGKSATLRALLAVAAAKGYVIHQLDVKTAYLYGELKETVYMKQPEGYHSGDPEMVCRLMKALYGTRQGAREWHNKLKEVFEEMGYTVAIADPSLFVANMGDIWVIVHVDDMLIAAPSHEAANGVKATLGTKFEVKDLGVASFFLGMEIEQRDGEIVLSQRRYTKEILEQFGMAEAAPAASPLEPGFQWGRSGEGEEPFADGSEYRSVVGALLYLANNTRPDLAHAVGMLARHMAAPGAAHWAAAKRVLRYLKGTASMGLHFGGTQEPWFDGYSDSDWGQDLTRRSTTGYIFTLNGGAVSWSSKRQQTVATSTMEAEYQAASSASREGLWLRQLGCDFGLGMRPIRVYSDNSAALGLIRNPIVSNRSKHIDISHHFVRERQLRNEVIYEYIPTASNVADVFTKALPVGDFVRYRAQMGVR